MLDIILLGRAFFFFEINGITGDKALKGMGRLRNHCAMETNEKACKLSRN